jgi:hypothetical protein
VRLLATYCQAHLKLLVSEREHIQAYIADQLAGWKPTTAHNRYRGLHAFFKWEVAEGGPETSPMDGMRRPQLREGAGRGGSARASGARRITPCG